MLRYQLSRRVKKSSQGRVIENQAGMKLHALRQLLNLYQHINKPKTNNFIFFIICTTITFILWLCFVFVETVLRRNLQLYKSHIYTACLLCFFFLLSIKEFFQSCTYTLMHINNNYYNTKIIYGNLALEFDEDHYNNSLPVKLAQQHRYVHHLKTNLLKSSISSLEGRDGE